jgi:hypothetical protein
MPITADGIRELMELGIAGDQLLAVVAIFERDASRSASRVTRDGARRMAAERSRKYREKLREASQPPSRDASRSSSRSQRDARSNSEGKKGKGLQGKEEKRGTLPEKKPRAGLLPDDFQPKPAHFDAARKLGQGEQFVRDKFEDMRIWATANGTRKVSWDATLHGFIRRDAKQVSNGNGTGHGRTNRFAGQAAPGADAVIAGMGRIAGRIHERRVSAGQGGQVSQGDDAPDLLDLEPVRTSHN